MIHCAGNLLPRGLYLDNSIRVAKKELARETDYRLEAESMETFRRLISKRPLLMLPKVYGELSTRHVLVTELMHGVPLGRLESESQNLRDKVN